MIFGNDASRSSQWWPIRASKLGPKLLVKGHFVNIAGIHFNKE